MRADDAVDRRAATYGGVSTATSTVALPNLLVVNRSMDDDLAYRLELHQGAARYYGEALG